MLYEIKKSAERRRGNARKGLLKANVAINSAKSSTIITIIASAINLILKRYLKYAANVFCLFSIAAGAANFEIALPVPKFANMSSIRAIAIIQEYIPKFSGSRMNV